MSENLFEQLPAIDKWLASETGISLMAEFARTEVVDVMREHLNEVREGLSNGLIELPDFNSPEYAALMRGDLLRKRTPSLRRIINATGVIIHTNLGRAPLADEAIEAMVRIARG